MRTLQALYVNCDEAYKRRIKVAAAERGISVARFMREVIDAYFAAQDQRCANEKPHASAKPIRYTKVRD